MIGLRKCCGMLWAFPCTALGLLLGLASLLVGGRCQWRQGVLEFFGGPWPAILRRLPIMGGAAAMTLGHTVLARTVADLDRSRAHEQVHVEQYERWGPLFLPAYLGSSLWLWLRGYDPYLDNPFEVEAFHRTDDRHRG